MDQHRETALAGGVARQGRHGDGIGEDPEGPAAEAGEAGLAEVGLGPVMAGSGNRQIEGLGLSFGDLVPVAENAEGRGRCAGRNRNVKRGSGSIRDGVARARGTEA